MAQKPVKNKIEVEAPEVAEEVAPVVDLGDDVAIAVVSPMGNVVGKADEVIPQPDTPVVKSRRELPSGNVIEEY